MRRLSLIFAILCVAPGCLTAPASTDSDMSHSDVGQDAAGGGDADDLGADDLGANDLGANDLGTGDTGTRPDATADMQSDMGPDMQPDMQPPCGGCDAPLVCDEATSTCVECLATTDCDDGVCATDTMTCVECVDSSTCLGVSASRCADDHTCAACQSSADCSHLTATTVCEAGECVECATPDDPACGGNACNVRDHTCTQVPYQSKALCEPCITDGECETDSYCVVMEYKGTTRNGGTSGYCLPLFSGACPRGTVSNEFSSDLPSLDDPTLRTYCAPNQALTTCEAFTDFGSSCLVDDDCGAESGDATCLPNGGVAMARCTYPCMDAASDQECPATVQCGSTELICGRP